MKLTKKESVETTLCSAKYCRKGRKRQKRDKETKLFVEKAKKEILNDTSAYWLFFTSSSCVSGQWTNPPTTSK